MSLIIVHHTAGPTTATAADIRAIHRAKGWSDIGYHWLIRRLGASGPWTCEAGRPEELVGAHDVDQNTGSIGIALAGDYSRSAVSADAWSVLVATVANRCRAYKLDVTRIEGHNEHESAKTATLCPGFDVLQLRASVSALLRQAA